MTFNELGALMKQGPNTTDNNRRRYHDRGVFFVTALAFCMTAWMSSARAQINPFRDYRGPTLTQEDREAGRAAARKLLNTDPALVGHSEGWIGPTTGNQGTLTIRRVFERAGMPCRSVAAEVLYQRTQSRRSFTLTACRTATGAWKLAD